MIRPRIAGHPIFRASEARDSTGLQPRGGPVPRVGAVQYLNTRPLVHGLSEHRLDLCYDLPSRLADRLADGSLDVALIPTVELFRSPGHSIVSNACIGCLGPVMSVKLFFRVAPSSVTTLAVDEGSRTSAALSRILLAERYDVHPAVSVLPIGANLYDTNADAVLLIGDRALGPGPGSVGGGSVQVVWDLGDEWLKWTGLPFVFAVWAAREGVDATGLAASLESARDAGVANLAAIAAAEAAGHGLTVPQCLAYLRDNLHFHLGERERSGLSRFQAHAERLGLVPSRPTVNARSVGTITDRHTV